MPEHLPYKVLVAIDPDVLDLEGEYTLSSNAVCQRALEAANRENGAELHLLTVVGAGIGSQKEADARAAHAAADLLKLAKGEVAGLTRRGVPVRVANIMAHVLRGSPAEEIVWLAANLGADLLVLGSHGKRGISRLLLGSVAEHVVRRAGCPVLVERSKLYDASWVSAELEPPCKDCVDARVASAGMQEWCARHLEHHARAHTYSDSSDGSLSAMEPWGFSG